MTYSHKPLAVSVLWTARILGALSSLFLLFMILGHLFGSEPQNLNGMSDIVALSFFPAGLLIGLLWAFKSEKIGGAIAFSSMAIFFLLRPDTIHSFYIVLLTLPAVLFFWYGWWLKPSV